MGDLTPPQRIIAGFWRDLLGVDVTDASDHFIRLGGNSLLAVRLANRIEDELGVRPDVVDLFDTLERVTAACEELRREAGEPS